MENTDLDRIYTRRLSGLLASDDGATTLALMQKLALRTDADARPPSVTPANQAAPVTDPVGIWERDATGWHRSAERREEWRYWADVDRIDLRPGRRVVVVGESVARGYLYDPVLTYAGLLAEELAVGQEPAGQVIDLARTNANFPELRRTVEESMALEPDVLVVFAGNNWDNLNLTPDRLQRLAEALRGGGFPAARRLFHALITEEAASALERIAVVAVAHEVAVVVVVPEFNLADWADEPTLVAPVLAGDQQREWLRLREQVRLNLQQDAFAEAGSDATRMTELDGGTSPVSARLLAAALAAHDPAGAEQALIAAKDAPVGIFTQHSPRVLTVVQQLLRDQAARPGFSVVDLPAVLRAASDGDLPGRQFFLDYCHLSFPGLVLAARATAAAVLTGSSQASASASVTFGSEADSRSPHLEPAAVGTAHFLAAVHNAHYGDRSSLEYHLREAIARDSSVIERCRDYLDYQTRTAEHWMCASYERSAAVPAVGRYLQAGDTRLCGKLADHDLREVMLSVLEENGVPVRPEYERLLVDQHAAPVVDLLADPARARTFRERMFHGLNRPRAYLSVLDLTAVFYLVMTGPADTDLVVTARLPAGRPVKGEVAVTVNDAPAGAVGIGPAWSDVTLTVPASRWRRGLNRIELTWPERTLPGDDLLLGAVRALERGAWPDSLPVYGHLYAFTATVTGDEQ